MLGALLKGFSKFFTHQDTEVGDTNVPQKNLPLGKSSSSDVDEDEWE